ncbi:MAG: RNA methyltransferase [Bacteroidales bacterium]|jgi:tRNA G18 (ribose-2'-O)-methylase SpoU|nr:RNA methyltransferase [Bacteroidales bacterium]
MKKLSLSELNRITPEEFIKQEKTPVIVILDNIRSMNNVGGIFRTCDAFVVEKLYLCGITATPPHKEITKTALGATESVEWEYVENVANLVHRLKQENIKVFLVEQTDSSVFLNQFPFPEEKMAIVLGNEVFGITEALLPLCDGAIEIPQLGTKHSLNVTIAAGIVLWEAFNQLKINNKN